MSSRESRGDRDLADRIHDPGCVVKSLEKGLSEKAGLRLQRWKPGVIEVDGVVPGSPAERFGFASCVGMLVVGLNGEPVDNMIDAVDILSASTTVAVHMVQPSPGDVPPLSNEDSSPASSVAHVHPVLSSNGPRSVVSNIPHLLSGKVSSGDAGSPGLPSGGLHSQPQHSANRLAHSRSSVASESTQRQSSGNLHHTTASRGPHTPSLSGLPGGVHPMQSSGAHNQWSGNLQQRVSAGAHSPLSGSVHPMQSNGAHSPLSGSVHPMPSSGVHGPYSSSTLQRPSAGAHGPLSGSVHRMQSNGAHSQLSGTGRSGASAGALGPELSGTLRPSTSKMFPASGLFPAGGGGGGSHPLHSMPSALAGAIQLDLPSGRAASVSSSSSSGGGGGGGSRRSRRNSVFSSASFEDLAFGAQPPMPFTVGDRVSVYSALPDSPHAGQWYPARVIAVLPYETFDVVYNTGVIAQGIPLRSLRALDKPADGNEPVLTLGNDVEVLRSDGGRDLGMLVARDGHGTYTVELYDLSIEKGVPRHCLLPVEASGTASPGPFTESDSIVPHLGPKSRAELLWEGLEWVPCVVRSYNPAKHQYDVCWLDGSVMESVPARDVRAAAI
eukprot:gene19189-29548_t